jgi:hypothetical protein
MFLYELAFHLGVPVYVIMENMPASELTKWKIFLDARPIGWREDNRTSMLLNVQGVNKAGPELFPTLAQLKDYEAKRSDEEVMQQSLSRSVFGAMLTPKGN